MSNRFKRVLTTCAVAAVLLGAGASAQSGPDANLSPKRVVFDPAARAATVFVFNQGDRPATYTVEVVDRVMREDGQIVALADLPPVERAAAEARLRSAREMVQFTPRRVTLGPNQSQAVRIRAQRPGGLGEGEYRTHLTVTAVPPADAGLTAEQAVNPAAGEVGVRVNALFGLSIPNIVRQGRPDVRARLENVRYTRSDAGPTATVDVVREGASSVYGDVEVRAAGRSGRSGPVLGRVRGVGVYPEIGRRTIRVPLSRVPGVGERLEAVFLDDDTRAGQVLASTAVQPG